MSESPFRVESVEGGGTRFSFDVEVQQGQGHKKSAQFDMFEILSDEGEALGGDNTAPPPLAFFSASLAF